MSSTSYPDPTPKPVSKLRIVFTETVTEGLLDDRLKAERLSQNFLERVSFLESPALGLTHACSSVIPLREQITSK